MKEKRIFLWDNIKFLLMFFVVVGHFVDIYTKNSGIFKSIFVFLYAFHMPLFIMISGMFHKNERIAEKFFSYVIIGVLCRTLFSVVKSVTTGTKLEINYFSESMIPWFMYALAIFIVITFWLRNANQKKVLILSIIIACLAGYDSAIGDFLCISRILVFYPFYVLGGMLQKDVFLRQAQNKRFKIIGAAVLIMWGLVCLFALDLVYKLRPIMTGRNPYVKLDDLYPYGGLLRLLWFAVAIVISFAVIWLAPTKKLRMISVFGTRTLQVYFWHEPFRMLISSLVCLDALVVTSGGKIVYLLMAFGMTMVLSFQLFAFPTKWIVTHKTKNSKNKFT